MQSENVGSHTKNKWQIWLLFALAIVAILIFVIVIWVYVYDSLTTKVQPNINDKAALNSAITPTIKTEVVLSGRQNIWDMFFLPGGELVFSERAGKLSFFKNGKVSQIKQIEDVYAQGEGGLLGITIDPKYKDNNYIYTCFNSTKGAPDVRVVRWKLDNGNYRLSDRQDILTGIPSNKSGRHSGCRVAFGPDDYLWVGTGDGALGASGQDPKGLAGKILRIDRNGQAAPGNIGQKFDARIFNYGHRNVQGLALFKTARPDGLVGFSVEHGSYTNDEVNALVKGNFGWAPPADYNEINVPMTDKKRFPDAVEAVWSSGLPTQAPSGATVILGDQWRAWNGAIAVAILKDAHLKILKIDENNKVTKEEKVLVKKFGRLRAVVQGPDNNLYVTTDNDKDDKIIKITPIN